MNTYSRLRWGNVERLPGPVAVDPLRKKPKVRSAWISFVGRILAQVIGAAASVVLGLALIQRYHVEPVATGPEAKAIDIGPVPRVPSAPGLAAVVVLPVDDYSSAGQPDRLSEALTDTLTAAIAQTAALRVLSRTSAMRYKGHHRTVPEIARELSVDLILETSIVRADAQGMRVTAQLIDGRSDEHVWARGYDLPGTDVLAVHAHVSGLIAREIAAFVQREPLRAKTSVPGLLGAI